MLKHVLKYVTEDAPLGHCGRLQGSKGERGFQLKQFLPSPSTLIPQQQVQRRIPHHKHQPGGGALTIYSIPLAPFRKVASPFLPSSTTRSQKHSDKQWPPAQRSTTILPPSQSVTYVAV